MMGVNTLLPLLTTLPLMTTLEKIVIGQKIIAFTGMNMIGVPAFSTLLTTLLTQLRTPLTERHTVPKMASIASAQLYAIMICNKPLDFFFCNFYIMVSYQL